MEKIFRCNICDAAFHYKSGLLRHNNTRKHALLAAIKGEDVPEYSDNEELEVILNSCIL